jgi:hypothetical protein
MYTVYIMKFRNKNSFRYGVPECTGPFRALDLSIFNTRYGFASVVSIVAAARRNTTYPHALVKFIFYKLVTGFVKICVASVLLFLHTYILLDSQK